MNFSDIIKYDSGILDISVETSGNYDFHSISINIQPINFSANKYSTDENYLISIALKVMKDRVAEIERMLKEEQLSN